MRFPGFPARHRAGHLSGDTRGHAAYRLGMMAHLRSAYGQWPMYDARLRDFVGTLSGEELARRAQPEGWPAWAIVGHLACQRVFWLCDFAGEPGAEATPFPNASDNCPGDDDLEHVLDVDQLVHALEASFRIVERALDTWTVDSLSELIRRPEWDDSWVHSRAAVIQRVFAHDLYHVGELSAAIGTGVDLWD
jgi:uncharacterized damage-inducible protein DinB